MTHRERLLASFTIEELVELRLKKSEATDAAIFFSREETKSSLLGWTPARRATQEIDRYANDEYGLETWAIY